MPPNVSEKAKSFPDRIYDGILDNLATTVVAGIAALAAGLWLIFLKQFQALESSLLHYQVSAMTAVGAAIGTAALCMAATWGYLSRRFRTVERQLRAEISWLDQASELERSDQDKVKSVIAQMMEAASANAHPLSLALVDIDNFKAVNDSYNYEVGNYVLQQFAQILRDNVRGSDDRVMRYFERGDEFLIVLPGTTLDNAYRGVAERLRKLVAGERFLLGDEQQYAGKYYELTMSVGLTQYLPSSDDLGTLLNRINQALQAAKRSGKNRSVPLQPETSPRTGG
jgi:diguanylate cyclase (GGDEF)-like protein